MSLYGMVFNDPNRPTRVATLLAVLDNPDPGRVRDAWVEKSPETGEPVIVIYTRNGGGNRECSCEDEGTCTGCVGAEFAEHPGCFKSPDDSFDCTYRTYYFRAPEKYRDDLALVAGDPVDTDLRWQAVIDAL